MQFRESGRSDKKSVGNKIRNKIYDKSFEYKYRVNRKSYEVIDGKVVNDKYTICLSMALHPFVGPWPPFSFLMLHIVGRTPWRSDQPVAKPLPTHRTTQTQNKLTQTFLSRVGFEPSMPVFKRVKTVHALDRAATVIGPDKYTAFRNVSRGA
jgi:hypothetical protein